MATEWHVTGNSLINPSKNFFGTIDDEPLLIKTKNVERLRIDTTGNIGIGTTNPYSQLHIRKDLSGALGPSLTLTNAAGSPGAGGSIDFNGCDFGSAALPTARIQSLDDGHYSSHLVFLSKSPGASNNSLMERMRITSDGNLKLSHVFGVYTDSGGYQREYGNSLEITLENSAVHFNPQGGNAYGGAFKSDLVFHGNIRIVDKHDLLLDNADVAEDFDVIGDEPSPGTVMVIDQDGALRESHQPYDKRVAGVISGAGGYRHGILLDKRPGAKGRVPLGMVGKVYCKVDAEQGPIEIGDLLTTSPMPGHAMKAADPVRAFGAVLGKALAPLGVGLGLIPVLIALQ